MFKKIIALFLLLPSLLYAENFIEGKDYKVLTQDFENILKPSVTEFFSYGCPWCYKLEAPLQQWIKEHDQKVDFKRVPVVFKPDWELYAKAYYTAESLGMLDKLNPLLFKSIQSNHNKLNTTEEMVQCFIKQGVAPSVANSAFKTSPSVDIRVKDGMRLMKAYQINAVPAFIVNNHFKTDLQMAKSSDRLIKILDYLMTNPD